MKPLLLWVILIVLPFVSPGQYIINTENRNTGFIGVSKLYYIETKDDPFHRRLYFIDSSLVKFANSLLEKKVLSFETFFQDEELKSIKPTDSFCTEFGINWELNSILIYSIRLNIKKTKEIYLRNKIIIYIKTWYEQGRNAICIPVRPSLKKLEQVSEKDVLGKAETCIFEI